MICKIKGTAREVIRALSLFKPIRLMNNFYSLLEKRKVVGLFKFEQLAEKSDYGEATVVDITTTAGTFIANGFVVHNCNDVLVTYESYENLSKYIEERNFTKQFEFAMDTYRTMHKVARRGIRFDTTKRTVWKLESTKHSGAQQYE